MKKKILSLCLVVAMLATAVVGASMAYLTDTEEAVNVMTVGKVDVSLVEKQRNEDGTALENFEQYKELTPLVGNAQGTKDKFGMPVAKNYVDKIVYATNNGNKEAYIRFLVAVPAALIPDTDDSSNNPLHWNWGNRVDITGTSEDGGNAINDEWKTLFTYADILGDDDKIASVTIDGEEYWVTYFTMQAALAAGADSFAVMSGLYLDNNVDYDDETGKYTFNGTEIDYDFSKGVNIPVLLQAVQTDGWDTIDQAFDEAFGEATVANAEEWFADVEIPIIYTTVEVTQADLATTDFTQDNARFVLSGEFTEPVTFSVASGLSQVYDASKATFASESTVTVNAPGVAHSHSSLNAERKGNVTVTGFEVQTLNVLAYNNESVTISDNKINSMSVIGGNFALTIDGNQVDGNFGKYTDGESQANEYGISLRICDYELTITNNTITDTYSHAIGINGRQGEAASDWGSAGANNKIAEFSGNSITVNTTEKTERGALKIWCDQVYAPYATSGHEPNAAAQAMMKEILADTTNVFTLGDGHTVFNIFDYKTSDGN